MQQESHQPGLTWQASLADLVVLGARQKADGTAGTIVVTPDGWYRLAEPFDVLSHQARR